MRVYNTLGQLLVLTGGGGGGGSVNFSAGTTSNNLASVVFSNSNGVSFGLNGSTITGSAGGLSNINLSAGTTSQNLSAFVLSNSNGVSFGLNGSTVTGSVATSLTNVNVSAGTTSNNLSAFVLSNSNNVSFGLNGSTITATATVASTAGSVNFSGGTTSNNLATIVFSNSNGVSFGLNGSTMTGSVATSLTAINLSAGTTSNNLSAFVMSNSNNVSFGLNGSTVTATITVPAQTNQTIGAYMSSNTTSSVSSGTLDARSMTFRGAGVASVGYSGGEVVISVPAGAPSPVNFSAGTTSSDLGSVVFSNSNGVTFGLNGSTITASVAAAGGGGTIDVIYPVSGATLTIQNGQSTLKIQPFHLGGFVTASVVHVANSGSGVTGTGSSQSGNIKYHFGIYTRNVSTLSRLTSGSTALSWSVTGSTSSLLHQGLRLMPIGLNLSLNAGAYWAGLLSFSDNTAGNAVYAFSNLMVTQATATFSGAWGQQTASSRYWHLGAGVFSAQTAALPDSIAFSQITGHSSQGHRQFWFGLLNYSH